jgi:hypothetical protein
VQCACGHMELHTTERMTQHPADEPWASAARLVASRDKVSNDQSAHARASLTQPRTAQAATTSHLQTSPPCPPRMSTKAARTARWRQRREGACSWISMAGRRVCRQAARRSRGSGLRRTRSRRASALLYLALHAVLHCRCRAPPALPFVVRSSACATVSFVEQQPFAPACTCASLMLGRLIGETCAG